MLQDGPGSDTAAVHRDFVARLLQAIRESNRAIRLVHISIPGTTETDRTAFSTTKREAERLIAESGVPFTILRPGFVVALAAYGGSAMVRSLAAFPLELPAEERAAPFQPVAMEDIAATIAWLAARDPGEANGVTWDLMQEEPVTLGGVIDQFRRAFGTGEWPRIAMPALLLDLGARLGDLANLLGWMPPMRTTAIAELRRGVSGNPARWMTATGIVPKTIAQTAGQRPATIQDKWFARLFPIKALMIASLVLFWVVSGFIALVVSYDDAAEILSSHGFPAVARRARHRRHQPDGYRHWRADRVPPHLGVRSDCRYRCVAGLHGRRGDPDAGPLDRAARRAGEDGAGDRADAGGAADIG